MLRDYQLRAIEQTYDWMRHNRGNPCLELPTGSGKSHIVAQICQDAVQKWGGRALMIVPSKELLEQNVAKMRAAWPNAPVGVVCAGLRKKQFGRALTFGTIGSLARHAKDLGKINLTIVDECHGIHHESQGQYRTLIEDLQPDRVIGLTATPYRMGHGLVTDGDAIFSDILSPVSIDELIVKGFLAPLRSKVTDLKFDTSAVRKRGGEFVESDLQSAVDTDELTDAVVQETLAYRDGRKSMLFFCTGVKHALNMMHSLIAHGVRAHCITGETPAAQRVDIIERFRSGEIEALTNANVLTTGFDAPNTDLIAMCRPTMSTALYVQIVGRGLRPKSHTDHCLVLDFAGVVAAHGPITAVRAPDFKGKNREAGEAPCKVCENCNELVATSTRVCPTCDEAFPVPEPQPLVLHNDSIMEIEVESMEIAGWQWSVHTSGPSSKSPGTEMLKIEYFGKDLTDPTIREYVCVRHSGYALTKAKKTLNEYGHHCNVAVSVTDELDAIAGLFNLSRSPTAMKYKKNGKFFDIIDMTWAEAEDDQCIVESETEDAVRGDGILQAELPF